MAEDKNNKDTKGGSAEILTDLLTEYLKGKEPGASSGTSGGGDLKSGSAKVVTDFLTEYLGREEFKESRERIRRGAGERLKGIRERYRPKRRRTPEVAALEKDLSLRLAGVETEAAELRLRLAELLEEEEKLRAALEEL